MIFFTLFLLNFRHFFYTLSLLKELKSINFLRHYIIFALTDESFALLSSIKEKIKNLSRAQRSLIMFEVCLLNQIYWVIGSVLGYYFKQGLNIDYSGVEFSLNALFIVLAYELYKQNPNLKISGDYGRLRQMFLIILDNAIKFSFENNKVDVLAKNDTIIIRDYGIGINEKDLPHIFDRFYKTHGEHNKVGTGLGLAIAKQIAERHNIELIAQNNFDGGAKFIFKIPLK